MNVKPGDLAVVISNPFVENVGAVISIRSLYAHSPDAMWLCDVTGRPLVGLNAKGVRGMTNLAGNEIVMPDKYLRPVSGLPLDETTDKEAKV
jgi:hypothetical protein